MKVVFTGMFERPTVNLVRLAKRKGVKVLRKNQIDKSVTLVNALTHHNGCGNRLYKASVNSGCKIISEKEFVKICDLRFDEYTIEQECEDMSVSVGNYVLSGLLLDAATEIKQLKVLLKLTSKGTK